MATIALCGILVEGGTSDWSALYLRELNHVNQGVAAAGFACFWAGATVVRFRADLLTGYTSPCAVARLGAGVAALGIAVAIAFPALPGALTGFTLAGIGTAVLVRLAFSAAANLGQSGTALALVTSSGYAGSIVGPALIGAVADHGGVRVAMIIPLAAARRCDGCGRHSAGSTDARMTSGAGGSCYRQAMSYCDTAAVLLAWVAEAVPGLPA